ncbi:MAG: hypothetical protein KDA21_09110 [Phycisphaerales bacterium]|nr:hypothetical protein [Phycisphaerales bacterium]
MTLILMAAAALLTVTGCTSNEGQGSPVSWARPYPQGQASAGTLDIQVIRRPQSLEMTNTSLHAFGPSTVWLNAEYALPIDGFAVGETLSLPLTGFRNEFSERFRAGGFFATRDPTRLVLAEIEAEDGRWGLIVVSNTLD